MRARTVEVLALLQVLISDAQAERVRDRAAVAAPQRGVAGPQHAVDLRHELLRLAQVERVAELQRGGACTRVYT